MRRCSVRLYLGTREHKRTQLVCDKRTGESTARDSKEQYATASSAFNGGPGLHAQRVAIVESYEVLLISTLTPLLLMTDTTLITLPSAL